MLGLLTLPCPTYVEGPVASGGDVLRSWVFRSSAIPNAASLGTKATYIWEVNRQSSQVEGRGTLYGGIALRHEGQSFLVFCSVCGEACGSGDLFRFSTKQRAAPSRSW